ncbi:hypothetical protein [Montanilutibacter psychrotolerans]|uniref:hypothetical protein n=1 Tax=Montanilutibacter psychrotolerans TaxID=1327343 RepID=UPI001CC1E8B0|nr:hypothetical protein [Lysobacter psychrotolerans]
MNASTAVTRSPSRRDAVPVDPGIETVLRYAVAVGAVLVLLLPAARGSSATIGWLPLWLLVMPSCAWWALHRFRLPWHRDAEARPVRAHVARRRALPQARRRSRPGSRPEWPKAA